jgi:hypothetical protein
MGMEEDAAEAFLPAAQRRVSRVEMEPQSCRSAQSILQLCLSMLLSYAQHLCSILQHMHGSHESMRRMMVEERLVYLLENAYKLFSLLSLTCLSKVLYICRLYFLL